MSPWLLLKGCTKRKISAISKEGRIQLASDDASRRMTKIGHRTLTLDSAAARWRSWASRRSR